MFREENKPRILTIHGIWSDGAWQEANEPLLKPYYRPESFKYREYRTPILSGVWLALQPVGGLVGLALAYGVLRKHFFPDWRNWALAALVVLLCWIGFGILASRRLNKVINDFVAFWGRRVGFESAPHIIAHSLGTYVTGTSLRKFESIGASRVILTGCVLHRRFGWHEMLGAERIREVRNEIARKDLVTRLAYLLHGFIPGMGHAGVFGFHDPPHTFTWNDPHNVKLYCGSGCNCSIKDKGDHATVHNVVHKELGHSDYFIGPSHAIAFWLPALWDIPALPYKRFRELCLKCREAELKTTENLSELERELRTGCWGWTEGTLENRVRRQLTFRLKDLACTSRQIEDLVSVTVRNLWCIVTLAVENQSVEAHAVNLNPDEALLNAIEATIKECIESEQR